eukprot:1931942-Amphidinium_carterae.1
MGIKADQRHVDMILRELGCLGIDAGVRGKYLPSVKMTAAELGQVAATAALTGEKVRKYRSLVMRIAYGLPEPSKGRPLGVREAVVGGALQGLVRRRVGDLP